MSSLILTPWVFYDATLCSHDFCILKLFYFLIQIYSEMQIWVLTNVMSFDKCIHLYNEHPSEDIKYFYHPRKFPHANPSLPLLCSDFYHHKLVLPVLEFLVIKLVCYVSFLSGFFCSTRCLWGSYSAFSGEIFSY